MGRILLKILLLTLFFIPTVSLHAASPIKILLVPGHDNEVWGAQFGNLKEADMNLALANKILATLRQDKRFEVHITRDWDGYTKEFADYFKDRREDIIKFRDDAKEARANNVTSGTFISKESVPHNEATENTSIILYGINKWADDNRMDAVIHIHFNDYPRTHKWTTGVYKGFSIYIPEEQMVDYQNSALLAGNIFLQLHKKYISSTYEKELAGVIPDQTLIALGPNGTLLPSVSSILIEYGYIYRFGNSVMRHLFYTNAANLTATGIKNYFFGK